MSRVIQITVSPSGSLFALTDEGDIYVTDHRSPWQKVHGPIPPRFSLPEEYAPAPCQSSATECEDSLDFNSLNGPGQGVYRSRFQKPQPRRPTSIGSDGNYLPPLGD